MDMNKEKKSKNTAIFTRPKPENIEPTQLHQMYATLVNKGIEPIDGMTFQNFNEEQERTQTPCSPEYIRDNTHF